MGQSQPHSLFSHSPRLGVSLTTFDTPGSSILRPAPFWHELGCQKKGLNRTSLPQGQNHCFKLATWCPIAVAECPEGFQLFRGNCYKMMTDKKKFQDANAQCATLGAHLVTVHSLAENFFVHHLAEWVKKIFSATKSFPVKQTRWMFHWIEVQLSLCHGRQYSHLAPLHKYCHTFSYPLQLSVYRRLWVSSPALSL